LLYFYFYKHIFITMISPLRWSISFSRGSSNTSEQSIYLHNYVGIIGLSSMLTSVRLGNKMSWYYIAQKGIPTRHRFITFSPCMAYLVL